MKIDDINTDTNTSSDTLSPQIGDIFAAAWGTHGIFFSKYGLKQSDSHKIDKIYYAIVMSVLSRYSTYESDSPN